MAEGEGFEPPDRVNGQWFSKPPHSTALPPLQMSYLSLLKPVFYNALKHQSVHVVKKKRHIDSAILKSASIISKVKFFVNLYKRKT